ncbi:unnamed protein product [Didymodactylos carnosus]|uniref:F-box domain-containing protein n=1 Tax=Didymodactylos carnosus TaxID=1234261 RepID=A0A815L2H4_9BILA|nr:unnamed protein product [Didymodactylos carnosus]CAF1546504.1 unnamed protein product [Didymodactylos carnosus]CAF4295083.1 unnamed protein product [Didymodactylos carnosus]CAF4335631.1 unnamed protein product [Didymodactylos carnosus]
MDGIFPAELFLEIFEYLPVIDIFRGFCNLNSYINSIINQLHWKIDLSSKRVTIMDELYIQQKIFPLYSNKFHHLGVWSKTINLKQFSNLRSLSISFPSEQQFEQIYGQTFPFLQSLSINYRHDSTKYQALCTRIFSNEFQQLKKCCLSDVSYQYLSKLTWLPIYYLESLTLRLCNQNSYYLLLKNLSKLKYFSVTIYTENDNNNKIMIPTNTIDNLMYLKLIVPNQSEMSMDELEQLVSYTPNLIRLSFHHEHTIDRNYLDFKRWKNLFLKLNNLNKFHCNITIDFLFENEHKALTQLNDIKYRHEHWAFECMVYERMNEKSLGRIYTQKLEKRE